MIYLNYTNLDAETQEHLMKSSKEDVENKLGEQLRAYADKHRLDYQTLLEEEAIKNLYSYDYMFNI